MFINPTVHRHVPVSAGIDEILSVHHDAERQSQNAENVVHVNTADYQRDHVAMYCIVYSFTLHKILKYMLYYMKTGGNTVVYFMPI